MIKFLLIIIILSIIAATILLCILITIRYCQRAEKYVEIHLPIWFNVEFYLLITGNSVKIGFLTF